MFWESIFERDEEFQEFLKDVSNWNRGDSSFGLRTATIMITGRCNYKCNYCWFKNNSFSEELPDNIWRGVIDQLADMGVGRIAFTGGEPLLYKTLRELISHARNRGIKTAIVSNGSLAAVDEVESLVDAGLGSFIFSLDTISRDLYTDMSGTNEAVFERVINAILYINKDISCWVGMICVLSPQIIPGLVGLLEFCRRNDIRIQFQPFLETSDMPALSVPEAEHVIAVIKHAVKAGTFIANSAEFIESMVEFAKTRMLPQSIRCGLPFYEMYFNPDGTVKACCISDIVGDIKQSSVREIWESKDYQLWRQKAVDRACSNCLLISHELMLKSTDNPSFQRKFLFYL